MDKSRHVKKELILKALESALGVVTTACKKTGVPRSTFYKWMNEDVEFAKDVKEIEAVSLDFAESKLFEQMANNNTAATIFYLKTKGKQRGYVERSDINIGSAERIKIDIVPFDEEPED